MSAGEWVSVGSVLLTVLATGSALRYGLPGQVFVLSAVTVVTVAATVMLLRGAAGGHAEIRAPRGARTRRRGALMLAAGVVCGGTSITVGAAVGQGTASYLYAGGALAAAVLLLAGLLLLPGTAPASGARIRQVLDGAAIGTCLFFAAWTMVLTPLSQGQTGPVGTPATTAVVLVTVLWAALAITTLAVAQSARNRACALLTGTGVAVALVEHTTAALLLLLDARWFLVLATAALWTVGPVLIWAGARRAAPHPEEQARRRGPWVAPPVTFPLLAVSAGLALLGGVTSAVAFRGWSGYTVMIALTAVGAVGVRGLSASADVRRYTARLAAQENRFRTTDALTGIGNLRRLRHRLEAARGEVAVPDRCGTLLVIDLDNFGKLDDVHGHDVGDTVLVEVARRLRASVSGHDLAVRLAGDAFAVLTARPLADALGLARRLQARIGEPYQPADTAPGAVHLTASVGVAECQAAASVDDMVRCAELAVSDAKEQGTGRIVQYDEALEMRVLRRRTYAGELRGALQRGELDLVFAPVVELADGRPVGLRTQVRWLHPTLGAVSEAELATAAADTGLHTEIGEWSLHRAAHQLSRWIAEGRGTWLSVTVPAAQLQAPGFLRAVCDLRSELGIPDRRLVLDVSEHGLPGTADCAADLAALRDAGVRTGLRDFGAGPCSLVELRTLPLDLVTIDRSLITPLTDTQPLVATLAGLARHLGHEVIAEGVADQWQADILRLAGCRYGQGPLYSSPLPAERAEAYLEAHADGAARQA